MAGLPVSLPGFDLPRQQWSLLNRFRMEQGHCGACRRKWRLTDTDLCPCGETQTMSHIVESCPLTKLNGGLSRLHSADEDAVSWLTNYGKWHAYEKKKKKKKTAWFMQNGWASVVDSTADFLNSARLSPFVRITGNDDFHAKSLLTKHQHAQFVVVKQFSHWSALPSFKTLSVKY